MPHELTNLLPSERQRALARDYLLRLGVVGTVLISVLILVAAVLLLPTYVFLVKSADAKEARLASVESMLASADEKNLSLRLSALTRNTAILTALKEAPAASGISRVFLAVSRPGITLSGFTYTPAGAESPGQLAISGGAATREALRNYQLALEKASFSRSAALPVSAYAKDSDIGFTITVTLVSKGTLLAP